MRCPSSDEDEQEDPITITCPSNTTAVTSELPQNTSQLDHSARPLISGPTQNFGPENTNGPISVQERRSSLPPGLLENGTINSICGQILRYMGDEQYSMACGRHLRCMGDQLCYNYFIRNIIQQSGEYQRSVQNTHSLTGSHSTPDLTK